MTSFELAAITDEASDDLDEALACLRAEQIRTVELRSLWDTNIADLTPQQVERARGLLRNAGMRVLTIASPFLKCHAPGRARAQTTGDVFGAQAGTLEEHWEVLRRSLAMCVSFEAPILRCFSFWRLPRPEEALPALREVLRRAVQECQRAGVTLALENEPVCTVGTGEDVARLVADPTGLEGLSVLWDPGNAACLGEQPYPAGYAAVRATGRSITHIHLKDLARESDAAGKPVFVPVGEGTIDYVGQLRALAVDGYTGALSLEPHLRQGAAGMRRSIAALRRVLAAAAV
jgi:sugar phosphate isomerase/epimerase